MKLMPRLAGTFLPLAGSLCMLLNSAHGRQTVTLDEVVRHADGSIHHMDQMDADNYCRRQGQRLPTARELAIYAQSLGAQGISSLPKEGYFQISGSTRDNPDSFYFSPKGYRRPEGELGSHWFWSSTLYSEFPSEVLFHAYILDGNDGSLVKGYDRATVNSYSAVRCVRSR